MKEGQKNILLPAEPIFLPETPQIPALNGPYLEK
jgi:hypothetical protein